jgi:hypothetical protein
MCYSAVWRSELRVWDRSLRDMIGIAHERGQYKHAKRRARPQTGNQARLIGSAANRAYEVACDARLLRMRRRTHRTQATKTTPAPPAPMPTVTPTGGPPEGEGEDGPADSRTARPLQTGLSWLSMVIVSPLSVNLRISESARVQRGARIFPLPIVLSKEAGLEFRASRKRHLMSQVKMSSNTKARDKRPPRCASCRRGSASRIRPRWLRRGRWYCGRPKSRF